LYFSDPNYIISGARDHVKVTMKAQTDVRHIVSQVHKGPFILLTLKKYLSLI